MLRKSLIVLSALCVVGCDRGPSSPKPQDPKGAPAPVSRPDPVAEGTGSWDEEAKSAIDRGIKYLRSQQTEDGKWKFNSKSPPEIGITGLCLLGMMDAPRKYREADGPFIRQGLEWIAGSQRPNGAIYGDLLATYNTSISILALVASENPKYRPVIDKAVEFLRVTQADEGEKYTPKDRYFGGVSYGDNERVDLSNTSFAVEAAKVGGLKDESFYKKVLIFASRCQNSSETNDQTDGGIVPGNDGGGYYSPGVDEHSIKAGVITLPNGQKVRRSYGSMSYALMKTYLFCNVERKDPRVRALTDWLARNYVFDQNPGMEGSSDKPEAKYAGLYYYYLSMARTLATAPPGLLVDSTGAPRMWKQDLAKAIVSRQQSDGAWVNEQNVDFWEASPVLATAYAINTLDACLK